jgi:hypothetical protein
VHRTGQGYGVRLQAPSPWPGAEPGLSEGMTEALAM